MYPKKMLKMGENNTQNALFFFIIYNNKRSFIICNNELSCCYSDTLIHLTYKKFS